PCGIARGNPCPGPRQTCAPRRAAPRPKAARSCTPRLPPLSWSAVRGGFRPGTTRGFATAPYPPDIRPPLRRGRSSLRTHASEREGACNVFGEALQRMVATIADYTARPLVFTRCGAPIETLVAGFQQQEVALRIDALDHERAPALEVRTRQLVRRSGVQVLLRAEVSL